jgi:hypothetical protein
MSSVLNMAEFIREKENGCRDTEMIMSELLLGPPPPDMQIRTAAAVRDICFVSM